MLISQKNIYRQYSPLVFLTNVLVLVVQVLFGYHYVNHLLSYIYSNNIIQKHKKSKACKLKEFEYISNLTHLLYRNFKNLNRLLTKFTLSTILSQYLTGFLLILNKFDSFLVLFK